MRKFYEPRRVKDSFKKKGVGTTNESMNLKIFRDRPTNGTTTID